MPQAQLTVDPHFAVGTVNRRLSVPSSSTSAAVSTTGSTSPATRSADADGFRTDVLELVRELGVSTIRYPGGNFVSGFRWEDAIGPREDRAEPASTWPGTRRRPTRSGSTSSPAGSRRPAASSCTPSTSAPAACRRRSTCSSTPTCPAALRCRTCGSRTAECEPHGIKMWCLGNEMDGPWQLGPPDRGGLRQARRRRRRRRCGSSTPTWSWWSAEAPSAQMPTFGCLGADGPQAHLRRRRLHLLPRLLRGARRRHRQLPGLRREHGPLHRVGCRHRGHRPRRAASHKKRINISFDEWNVWYITRYRTEEQITDVEQLADRAADPRGRYSVLDAVVVGNLLISLLKHADRVTSASLAQLVNVIAPIMTEPGGPAWRQTTFFPFAITSRLAVGPHSTSSSPRTPTTTAAYGEVPLIDAVATHDADDRSDRDLRGQPEPGPAHQRAGRSQPPR